MKRFFAISLIILLASVLIFVGCAKPEPEVKTLRIGIVAGLTGPISDFVKVMEWGAQVGAEFVNNPRGLPVNLINKAGGVTINGKIYQVELVVEDHKCTPDGASAAATKLVFDHKVSFISGIFPPYVAIPVTQVTDPNKVIFARMGMTGTKAEYGPTTPYQFLCNYGYPDFMEDAVIYLKELYPQVKTLVSVMIDDGQIVDNGPACKAICEKHGITMLGDVVGYPIECMDATPYAVKALERKPDAIMTGNGPADINGQFMKIVRQRGFTGPCFAANQNDPNDTIKFAGKENARGYWTHHVCETTPEQTPLGQAVTNRLVEKYNRPASMMMTVGTNAIYTLVQAIEAAQSFDPTVVKETWEKMNDIDTIYGPGKMGGLQSHGIRHSVYHRVPIYRVENGAVQFGKWVSVYNP